MDAEQVARCILIRFKASDKKPGQRLRAGAIAIGLKRAKPAGLGLTDSELDAGRDFAVDRGWIMVEGGGADWKLTETGYDV